jgi:hypothetical protein
MELVDVGWLDHEGIFKEVPPIYRHILVDEMRHDEVLTVIAARKLDLGSLVHRIFRFVIHSYNKLSRGLQLLKEFKVLKVKFLQF